MKNKIFYIILPIVFMVAHASAVPAVTATKTNSLSVDVNGNGRANPGDTIKHNVTITIPSGSTNVQFSDPLDSNTTFLPGSLHASPIAFDDSYTAVGNTKLYVGITPPVGEPALVSVSAGLLGNDTIATSPDTISFSGFTTTTTQGGSVTVNASGNFTYTPPVGFTGTDTFNYTNVNSADASLKGVGTVTVTVSGRVWYIDNSGASGNGSSASPFSSLASVSGASGSDTNGDIIYIATGVGSYIGGIVLSNNQTLWGQSEALVVNGFTLQTAGSHPVIVNASGNGITLASGNTIKGLTVGSTTTGGIVGGAVGSLTVSNVILNGPGPLFTVSTSGALNVTLDSATTTNSAGTGISLTGTTGNFTVITGVLSGVTGDDFFISGGTANVTNNASIANTAGHSVNISGKTGGAVVFNVGITDTGTGILLNNNTGATIDFLGALALNTVANAAFTATGGGTVTATVPTNTIVTTTGTALNVVNTTIGGGGLTFKSINSGTGAGGPANAIILNNTGNGGLTVTGTGAAGSGGTIQKTTGHSISLIDTKNVDLSFMNIQNSSAEAIDGLRINNFSLSTCSISGNTGTGAASVYLTDTTGAVLFANDNVSGTTGVNGFNVQLHASNSSTAAITTLTVIGGSYNNSAGNGGFLVDQKSTAKIGAAWFSGVTFSNNFSKGLQLQQNDNSVMGDGSTAPLGSWVPAPPNGSVTVTGCTFITNNVAASFEGGGGTGGSGTNYYRFVNNTNILWSHSVAVNFANGSDSGGGAYKALVSGNRIGIAGVANSGSAIGEGLRVFMQGQQTATVTITNNFIRSLYNGASGFGNRCIDIEELGRPTAGSGQTRLDVKVVANDVDAQFYSFPLYSIYVAADAQGTGSSGSDVRAEIHGNTVPTPAGGACDTQCGSGFGMIFYETVSGATGTHTGTLFNFSGSGASVSAEIAAQNAGTSGQTCSAVNGGTLTLTGTLPNTVP